MRRLIGWVPIGMIALIGCGGNPPVATESEAQGATRVFAVAQELESRQKMKQAMDAYQQVIQHFPNTPEAKKAADRVAKAQRDATRNAATRNRK